MPYVPDSMCRECSHYRSGTLISTSSGDFPHVVYVGRNSPIYLFPMSLYFVEHRQDLTKAQKSKLCNIMSSGEYIDFVANKNNIVTSYTKSSQLLDRKVQYNRVSILMQDYIIISPSIPRRCWSTMLAGYVDASQELMNAIPNIVYDAYLAVDAYLTEPIDGYLPQPHITFALSQICKPVPNNTHVDEVYHVEWNLPDTRNFFHEYIHPSDSSEVITEMRPVLPRPPSSVVNGAKLYVMDNRQLIWPAKPYYKVVMGLMPSENEKKLLIAGKNMKADMFFCRFNQFYVVYRYSILSVTSPFYANHLPLQVRQQIDSREIGGYTEYYVELIPSAYHGFYVNHNLKKCLIDDPKYLLLNSLIIRGRNSIQNSFKAWIRRCTATHDCLQAPTFSVSSLDDEQLAKESQRPLIVEDSGFIVNICTGTIFCAQHPTLRILLMIPDRVDLQLGEYIEFSAVYFELLDAFIVVKFQSTKNKFPEEVIPTSRGFMFEDMLNCTTVKASRHLYESKKFGLVTDLEKVIRTKAEAENLEMPRAVQVLVEENEEKNRITLFNVYIVQANISQKELGADEITECPPTCKWWKSADPAKCKCKEIEEMCQEIADMKNSFIFNDFSATLNEKFDKL